MNLLRAVLWLCMGTTFDLKGEHHTGMLRSTKFAAGIFDIHKFRSVSHGYSRWGSEESIIHGCII